MDERLFKERTKKTALRIISLVAALPKNMVAEVLGKQLLRSGTSLAANYRAACRAKSRVHFISKLRDVEEEADESLFWMELIVDRGLVKWSLVKPLSDEVEEILAMVVASINTLRAKESAPPVPLRPSNEKNRKFKAERSETS